MIHRFREVWLVDFEFHSLPGETPTVVCLVAQEFHTGRVIKLWANELDKWDMPPYAIDPDSVLVAYFATAEMSCHLALGWQLPSNLLDLYVEFKNVTNGLDLPTGRSLLGALQYFGLASIDRLEKEEMRELIMTGGPWSEAQKAMILDYCETDVVALGKLLPKLLPLIGLPYALLRGEYIKSLATTEYRGTPVDLPLLTLMRDNWGSIKTELIAQVDRYYGVYDRGTFKSDRFVKWVDLNGIPWPLLPSGSLDLKRETFKDVNDRFPEIGLLHELRITLSQMRLVNVEVGQDGRNRCLLSPFSARTSRNQPSTNKYIFGPAKWLRHLIKPSEGMGLAYIDWSQQEFGIAAALSGDPVMKAAYHSGDPYLTFAKQAQAVPGNATKDSHPFERSRFKSCALAVQYGMGADSLALRIGQPRPYAEELLLLHKRTYKGFWTWQQGVLDYAMLRGELYSTFGWKIHVTATPNLRSLGNYPMQTNGAEMLRLFCCMATREGIRICAPVHDAVLIEAPLEILDHHVTRAQELMSDASAVVLDGFRLGSDVKIIRYPDRYTDERGADMWSMINAILRNFFG